MDYERIHTDILSRIFSRKLINVVVALIVCQCERLQES
jgi:hypothetical protein